MNYTKEDVIRFVKDQDIRFICLSFCDIYGRQKNVTIMPWELERTFSNGISLDASQIDGFQMNEKIDLLAKPDPTTMAELPASVTHLEQGRVIRMFANIFYPDGRPFENDTRAILQKAVETAKKRGYSFNFGPAIKFYLMEKQKDERGNRKPYDDAGYMDTAPEDKCELIRRTICMDLMQMNIQPEAAYHEEGPGQNKIKFHYQDPVTAADAVIGYKSVVKDVAYRNGIWAEFSPKPLDKLSGNGMHVNMSITADNGENMTPHIIAGILACIPEMTVFFNPTTESYNRLGHETAPRYISWSDNNRSTLIRIPTYGGYNRFELRSPDNEANPYITFALLIYASLYGIDSKPQLQRPNSEDLFTTDPRQLGKLKMLPKSLQEAQKEAKNGKLIKQCLPESVVDWYLKNR